MFYSFPKLLQPSTESQKYKVIQHWPILHCSSVHIKQMLQAACKYFWNINVNYTKF